MEKIKKLLPRHACDRLDRALNQGIALMNIAEVKDAKREDAAVVEEPVAKRGRELEQNAANVQVQSPPPSPEELKEVLFFVQGANVDMYTVKFTRASPRHPTCSCRDFEIRGEYCKHIYNVIFKTLFPNVEKNLDNVQGLLFSPKRPAQEEDDEEEAASVWRTIVASERERQSKPLLGPKTDVDMCSICHDDMDATNIEQVCWCSQECRTPFHRTCMEIWLASNKTCPMCRKQWMRWVGGMRMGGKKGWL